MPAYNKTLSQAKLHNFLFEPNIYIAVLPRTSELYPRRGKQEYDSTEE